MVLVVNGSLTPSDSFSGASRSRIGLTACFPKLRSGAWIGGSKDHIKARSSHSGSKAPCKGDIRNHGSWDPYVDVALWGTMDGSLQTDNMWKARFVLGPTYARCNGIQHGKLQQQCQTYRECRSSKLCGDSDVVPVWVVDYSPQTDKHNKC